MGAHTYDPATGRFTQRDAMPASATNPRACPLPPRGHGSRTPK